jgi:uncharacterized protein (TIGR00730 family)
MSKMNKKSEDAWQILRIQGEFTKGFDTLNELYKCISVFGSARTPKGNKWYKEARKFGGLIANEGFGVITGGGPGIMEAANQGAKEVGGKSIGVGIELPFEAGMNPHVDLGIECRYFFTRKVLFAKYAQAFVVFPGGMGTMDELFEVMTLAQTGHAPEFPILLVGKKYWSGLVDWLQETVAATGRMSQKDFDLFRIVDTAEEAVEKLVEHNAKYRKEDTTNF